VTDQHECDRIIKTAEQIALSEGCELRVLTILKPMTDYTVISDEIEYLNLVSRESGADMTVLFHENAPKICAQFAKQNNVQRIVTGMHDGGKESFLVMFNRYAPEVSITMVSEENVTFSMDVVHTAVR
jgi:K+-sensing histidine kinase KdpD